MYKIKLQQDSKRVVDVNRKTLELETRMEKPNYVKQDGEQWSVFGACPKCNNPVQVHGLYLKDSKKRPHAKHITKSVDEIAKFDLETYELCPYHNKNARENISLRRKESPLTMQYLKTLIEHFDQVVYLLEKKSDLKLSVNLWTQILDEFIDGAGHRSHFIEAHNLPYIFVYLPLARSLFAQQVKVGSDLYAAIKEKCDAIALVESDGYVKITAKGKQFASLDFVFYLYQDDRYGETGIESITLSVFIPYKEDHGLMHTQIFEKTIVIDDYFERLVGYDKHVKSPRDVSLLKAASKHAERLS